MRATPTPNRPSRPRWALAVTVVVATVVVALTFARGLMLAVVIPPLQSPDEDAHVDTVQFLAETGRLPPGGGCSDVSEEVAAVGASTYEVLFHPERRLPDPGPLRLRLESRPARTSAGCGPASMYPPLYYATAALGYRAVYGASILERIFAMRLVSVLWGCAGALAAFWFGSSAFGRTRDGLLLGLVWASQPEIGLLTSTVNNDAALFAISAACFAVITAIAAGARPRIALGVLTGLSLAGALTKPTFTGVLPVLLVASAVVLGGSRLRSWAIAATTVAPALLATWLWNRGLVFPHTPQSPWHFVSTLVLDSRRVEALWVRQYWMTYGWDDTALMLSWYRVLEWVTALAVVGILLGWKGLSHAERSVAALAMFATLIQLTFLYGVEYRVGTPILQGRYLLPMFVPQAAGCVVGVRSVARRLGARLDAGWSFALLLIAVQIASVVRVLGRYHA